jgi:cytochrome P450
MASARVDARSDPGALRTPAMGAWENLAGIPAARRDLMGFLERAVDRYGDVFRLRLGGVPMLMVNRPDYVQHVLVDAVDRYDKDTFLYRSVQTVMRQGLVANIGGESWRTQRRLMQPSFQRRSIAAFAGNITDLARETFRGWDERARPGQPLDVDVTHDVADLALRIILRTLFGVESGVDGQRFARDFVEVNTIVGDFVRFPFPPLAWRRRLKVLMGRLDAFVDELVRDRMAERTGREDLFGMLLGALDEESGTGLTRGQLYSELLAMIIAGYETSSNVIAWLFHQLATHPEMLSRVQQEADDVLGGRTPAFEDLPDLPYARMVIDETLRLFTPAWQTVRHALEDDDIGGHRVRRGESVYINFFLLHRNPRHWPDPARFDPERFSPEAVAARPRNVYQPFGTGPRHCIGKHLALTELHLITVMLAQAYDVTVPDPGRVVGFAPLITLQPAGGIRLRLRRR